ncbi:membrane protein insertase YidC [Mycoplasma phocoeninasale]|uniref:membrane protein insertase YidC n=1 Tax=Mycoplasma phocoeninasale TaxID=2726117 RepID=UPI001966DFEE|nr:membrane protein insertase YidC [Mycoplasma phocoeninasale]MBN0970556.1 membrane protein insertase YidC [Mycoplasma phocoeninasale]
MADKDFSKHYQDFRSNGPKEKAPKQVWTKVWKWLKIVIIIIFITVGLVGCVQSLAVKSSSKVGSGQELYVSKEKISPNIITFRYNEATNSFFLPNKVNERNIIANNYLSLKDPKALEEIREQDKNTGDPDGFGVYGGNSFALQLQTLRKLKENDRYTSNISLEENWANINGDTGAISENSDFVYKRNNRYSYINLGEPGGFGATKKYNPVSNFSEIVIPTSVEFDQIRDANGSSTLDNKSLQKFTYGKLLSTIEGGSSVQDILLRDLLQILLEETLFIWNKKNLDHNVSIADSNNNSQKINKKVTLRELLGTSENSSREEIVSHWNQYIKSFANKIGKNTLSEEEGMNLFWISSLSIIPFRQYLELLRYSSSAYKVDNETVFTKNNITELGNYDDQRWISQLYNSGAVVPQKPISTYKEYWQQGPFYGIFVYPVNALMNAIMSSLGATGWSVILALIIIVIIVRFLTFVISFKTLFSQAKMEEFNQKKAKIEAKYAEYKNDKQMNQRKQLEISELYKKEKISPWGQMATMFITLPILIVVFRIISTSPEIKQATIYGIQLSATSISRVFSNREFSYLPIIIISLAVQALAQYMPKILNIKKKKSLRADAYQREALKKEKRKFNIISLIFIGIGVLFSAGLQIYWIFGGIWTILQHIFVHYFQRTKFFKAKIEPKL